MQKEREKQIEKKT